MEPHFKDDNLKIHKVECGPYGNNAYLVICNETNQSILIDTPAEPEEIIKIALDTDVKYILITHNHMDHLLGFEDVTSALPVEVNIGRLDSDAIDYPKVTLLDDGDEISFGKLKAKAIFTPGHTDGSTCFVIETHLFTGDTLFPGGPGKSRSPEHLGQIIDGITKKLFPLGDSLNIYPGHGPDGKMQKSKEDYEIFSSREHPAELYGDVEWLTS